MCTRFDVTPRTLRYYEYIELLKPEKEGRTRFYGSKETARMTLILRGRRWGFALEDIRQWLLIYEKDGTEAQMRAWVDLATTRLAEMTDEKRLLEEAITELTKTRDQIASDLE